MKQINEIQNSIDKKDFRWIRISYKVDILVTLGSDTE